MQLSATHLSAGAGRGRRRFDPRMLFAAGQNGLIYPTEFGGLFQDSAGTTPATATNQPLGLTLDEKKRINAGPNLIINGSFDAGTTSWVPLGTGGTVFSVSDGVCTITRSGDNSGRPSQIFSTTPGLLYAISVDVINAATAAVQIAGIASSLVVGANKTLTVYFFAVSTSHQISIWPSASSASILVDNVSVKEIPGNHAFQSTAIDRPILQSDLGGLAEVYNGTSSQKTTATGGGSTAGFFWCGALRLTKTGSAQTLFSSAGSNTGYRVRINASNQLELAAGNGSAFVTAAASASLAGGERFVLTAWHDGTTLRCQVNNGPVATASMGAVTAGTAQITVGKDNNAASNYFGGWLYYQLHRQTVPTDSEIAQLKRWLAARVGVTL